MSRWPARLACGLLAAASPSAARTSAPADTATYVTVRPSWNGPGVVFVDSFRCSQSPEVVRRVAPECPDGAGDIRATVLVQVLAGADGLVKTARIARSVPPLDSAAVTAARQWVFAPMRPSREADPIPVVITIPIAFRCGGAREEARDAFAREVLALQADGPRVPSPADSARRRSIVRDALALDPRPEPPTSARRRLAHGRRALERCSRGDSLRFAVGEFTAALHQAPWWGQAYGQLGHALLRQARNAEAGACLELYLAAEPDAPDRDRVRRRVAKLRQRGRPAR